MYFKKLVGEKVYLSPRDVNDAAKYLEWLCDYETAKFLNYNSRVLTLDEERQKLANPKEHSVNLSIIDKENDELIGSIGLGKIEYTHGTAELGIFIGEKDYRSHGYGSEAIKLLLGFAFDELNLNNVMLKVLSFNERAIKAYKKCGFKKFGVWEKSHYVGGEYCDIIFMNVLKEDFKKQKKL